ncbi:MAG TPA: hypothetical protein P5148_01550, partial [Anaerolineae bacterium]|nr:hypothetical protein [Anaerolineae bacterium]
MKMSLRGKKRSLLAASAIMLAVLALSVGATAAFAQGSPNPQQQGPGQFCIDDSGYPSGANC